MARKSSLISAIVSLTNPAMPVWPYESVYDWMKRTKQRDYSFEKYQRSIWKLQRRGFLKIVEKNNKRFVEITSKGQLEILVRKAGVLKPSRWDGKWRVLVFDIPECSRKQRDNFRFLLKRNGFIRLQASVFISPYPLNQEALAYLRQTGLNDYIRIMRVDSMDDDSDLHKKFNLVVPKNLGRERKERG